MSWDVGITTIPERDEDYSSMYGDVNTLMSDIQKVLGSLKALAGNSDDISDKTVQELAEDLDGAAKSTDGTFADNSDAKLPTEKAVKTYVSNNTVSADDYSCLFYPSYKNLTAKPNTSNPNYQVDVAWDELRIENRRTTSKSFTVDITASGALGLDTGSEAVSTWYYIWAICNDAGTTVSAILSASAAAPTLPSGYTKKRLIGAVYNMADGHFRGFEQKDRFYGIARITVLDTGLATTYTVIDLAALVPQQSYQLYGMIQNNNGGSTTTIATNAEGHFERYNYEDNNHVSPFTLPVTETQKIYYKITSGAGFVYVSGCEINI